MLITQLNIFDELRVSLHIMHRSALRKQYNIVHMQVTSQLLWVVIIIQFSDTHEIPIEFIS